jgi:hypothetical protein
MSEERPFVEVETLYTALRRTVAASGAATGVVDYRLHWRLAESLHGGREIFVDDVFCTAPTGQAGALRLRANRLYVQTNGSTTGLDFEDNGVVEVVMPDGKCRARFARDHGGAWRLQAMTGPGSSAAPPDTAAAAEEDKQTGLPLVAVVPAQGRDFTVSVTEERVDGRPVYWVEVREDVGASDAPLATYHYREFCLDRAVARQAHDRWVRGLAAGAILLPSGGAQ